MDRRWMGFPMILILCFIVLYSTSSKGSYTSQDNALIIVSTYEPNGAEYEKALEIKGHLLSEGIPSSSIRMLYMGGYQGCYGDSDLTNIEDSFEWIAGISTVSSRSTIYISDHSPPTSNSTHFCFTDGNLSYGQVDDWVEALLSPNIDVYVGGNHSGRAGPCLSGPGRTVICSMGSSQSFVPDNFDLERSLSDPNADTDEDGWVSFEEAYYREIYYLQGSGQSPVLYSP